MKIPFEKFMSHLIVFVRDVFPDMHTYDKVYLCEQILKDLAGLGINKSDKKYLLRMIVDVNYRDIILGFDKIIEKFIGGGGIKCLLVYYQ